MVIAHPKFTYTHGLHALGNGAYAWLQPDGGWGWSNSGLIVDDDQALIVDTLFDVPLTQTMLAAYADASKSARQIDMIVNTHHNGDHCNGNCCCPDARIIAHKLTRDAMQEEPPSLVQGFLDAAPDLGDLGDYLVHCFGPFDFKSVTQKLPDETFEKTLSLGVGAKQVELIHVGPAHTPGDTLVHVPQDKLIFTGDILFIGGHPIIWEGPVQNWLDACHMILALDVEVVVPGHGPITTKQGVQNIADYLTMLMREAKKRYDAGLSAFDAAMDIILDAYNDWTDGERIVINCATLYREFDHAAGKPVQDSDIATLFADMARYRLAKR